MSKNIQVRFRPYLCRSSKQERSFTYVSNKESLTDSCENESLISQDDECIICSDKGNISPKEFSCALHSKNYCRVCSLKINKCPICRNDVRLINEEYYLMRCKRKLLEEEDDDSSSDDDDEDDEDSSSDDDEDEYEVYSSDDYSSDDYSSDWNLGSIPVYDITQKICDVYVNSYPHDLEYVPIQFFTFNLCVAAIEKDWTTTSLALSKYDTNSSYLNENTSFKHADRNALCFYAVRQHANALFLIPDDLTTDALYIEAIKKKPQIFERLKVNKRTQLISEYAVNCDVTMYRHVPEIFRTKQMSCYAVHEHCENIVHVPKAHRSEALLIVAIMANPSLLIRIDISERTSNICAAALNHIIHDNNQILENGAKVWNLILFDQF